MNISETGELRPPLHLLASESDFVASLALQAEHRQPLVAAMLLEEIERAELHDAGRMPDGHVQLNSSVTYLDERSGKERRVQIVVPARANITEGRISILTPMGAALYGLAEGARIDWPDLDGNRRPIRVVSVEQPAAESEAA
ncbi:MAG TPA: nucleoside diphosphate kinase regulator [Sphingomicrobium sp.]|nr:nucleoside diphosphate kinase regulator [Sphingomicrobium sp.]